MDASLRPTPLRYSAPSTARFVILVLALLCNGLFVGTAVHNVVEGDRWVADVAACDARSGGSDPLERQRAFEECAASAEQLRTVYSVTGGAVGLLAGLAVAIAAPAVIRRRRGLKPLPPQLDATSQRVRHLAAESGVRRAPDVLRGRLSQRDAFSFGLPGAYRIALPPKLALRPTDHAVFDPIVLHELAHVSHHDVALAWVARGVWLAVVPLACVPLVFAIVNGDFSIVFDYAWRAVVLLVVVRLVANEVLRVREHEADVAVGNDADRLPSMLALLSTMASRSSAAPNPGLWKRLGAQHPSPARRVEVLEDPTAMLQPTILEGFTAALLAATVQPLLQALLTTALTGTGNVGLSVPLAAVVAAILLGGSIGVGLWRAAVYGRVSQWRVRVRGLGIAVGGGLAVGQFLSFAQVSATLLDPSVVSVVVLWLCAGMGATVLVSGLGSWWADLAPRMSRARWHRLVALVAGTVVFALALWGAGFTTNVVSWGGWSLVFLALTTSQVGLIVGGLALAVAVAVPMASARGGRAMPTWVAMRGQGWSWPIAVGPGIGHVVVVGVACGLGGAAAIAIFRGLAGPAASDAESLGRFFDYALVAAAAGVVGVVILALSRGSRGAAASIVAIPIAATTTLLGFVALNGALGGFFPLEVLLQFLGVALTAGIVAAVPVAAITLLSPWAESVPAPVEAVGVPVQPGPASAHVGQPPAGYAKPAARWPKLVVIPVVALVFAALLGGSIPVLRLSSGGSVPLEEASAEASEEFYVQTVVPPLKQGFTDMLGSVDAIVAAQPEDPAIVARRIREELLPILDRMQVKATEYQPPTAELEDIHRIAMDSIEAYRAGYSDLADAYDASDMEGSRAAAALVATGTSQLQEWLAETGSLGG